MDEQNRQNVNHVVPRAQQGQGVGRRDPEAGDLPAVVDCGMAPGRVRRGEQQGDQMVQSGDCSNYNVVGGGDSVLGGHQPVVEGANSDKKNRR